MNGRVATSYPTGVTDVSQGSPRTETLICFSVVLSSVPKQLAYQVQRSQPNGYQGRGRGGRTLCSFYK